MRQQELGFKLYIAQLTSRRSLVLPETDTLQVSFFSRNGYRKIHDTEIVRAILYGKTTNFCNPASQPGML